MVLNNPKVREALMGGAATANQKVRQQIETFVQQQVQEATVPLFQRIRELEARVAALEARAGGQQAQRAASQFRHDDF